MEEKAPIIVLNFKAYRESIGKNGVELARIAKSVSDEFGTRIAAAPQFLDLKEIAALGIETFAQSADEFEPGSHTGAITLEAIKDSGCEGVIMNHAERRISKPAIKKIILRAKGMGLETILCTKDLAESVELAALEPDYIAIEPPELIGSGISVSRARPEIVADAVKGVSGILGARVLCGAGISSAEDVRRAIELGASGVLLSSAYIKAKNPEGLLREMAECIRGK
ncbi:MAG: triose-phosphate isomerase [archaeon]